MTIEEAIKTAIEYENKVERVYREALQKSADPVGQRVFKTLADEEQQHVAYLEARLAEWQKSGHVTAEKLATAVPPRQRIEEGARQLDERMSERREMSSDEVALLQQALEVELETSSFYRRVVDELDGEGKQLFARFVEIEEGHVTIVQAEIDSVTGLGYWLDFPEWQFRDG